MIEPGQNPQTTAHNAGLPLALARLEAWLETMRGPGGYGGPVSHWWQQSLLYTGPGLDWRYQGIITGYLTLWERTGAHRWLEKACRAGDDLVAGQLADGHFAASAFEMNPASAGTPHEAACDVGLLHLALALEAMANDAGPGPKGGDDDPAPATDLLSAGRRAYAGCAERNLQCFYIEKLWDTEARAFRDDPKMPSFVPNKAATACEVCFLLSAFRGDERWVNDYGLSNLERILEHQVRAGGQLDGAIAQNSVGRRTVQKYFPIYMARCVPALLHGYAWTGEERYLDAAMRAMHFIARRMDAQGGLPTVIYADGQANHYPGWVAPLADVLWAAQMLRPFGFDADLDPLRRRLLAGQDRSGGFQTATGFAAQTGERLHALPDVRDLLHVAGWCDKVFRYLAGQVTAALPEITETLEHRTMCSFQGETLDFHETCERVEIRQNKEPCYRWRKGTPWAEVAAPAFWLR